MARYVAYFRVSTAAQGRSGLERASALAPIVFPLIEQGQSYSAIARHLNNLGIPTAKGGQFYPETAKNVVLRLKTEFQPHAQ